MSSTFGSTVPTKLVALAAAMAVVFLQPMQELTALIALLGLGFFALQGLWKQLLSLGTYYAIISALYVGVSYFGLRMLVFSEFHVFLFWGLSPVFIVAWNLILTPPGTVSAFLSRLKAPSYVTLGMLVVFRFFPTMSQEMKALGQSMRNRGLLLPGQIVAHPAQTAEHAMMPVLMRVVQIADQLAVSAVARGIERGGRRESYYRSTMRASDWIVMVVFIFAAISIICTGNGWVGL